MFEDVEHGCKSCIDCAIRKSRRNTKRALLLPLSVEGAFDRGAVDVLAPFKPSKRKNRYIVVFSDYLTRWREAFPVPSVEANVIARLLVDEIIARHGTPRVLLSDSGTNFVSKRIAEVCKIFRIQKVPLSITRKQTDFLRGSIQLFANHFLCTWPISERLGRFYPANFICASNFNFRSYWQFPFLLFVRPRATPSC